MAQAIPGLPFPIASPQLVSWTSSVSKILREKLPELPSRKEVPEISKLPSSNIGIGFAELDATCKSVEIKTLTQVIDKRRNIRKV